MFKPLPLLGDEEPVMIKHYPHSIEDACADEYAARAGEAERLCRWLAATIEPDGSVVVAEVRGARHRCDRLVTAWAEFAIARDQQTAALSPINPKFLS